VRIRLTAALVPLVALVAAGCASNTTTLPPATAAPPQSKQVEWVELTSEDRPRLVFGVRWIEILRDGWRARISVRNETDIPWRIGGPGAVSSVPFGVMLFATGDLEELSVRNRDQNLPGVRYAHLAQPPPPEVLEPNASWEGTVSAPGALAAGRWLRVTFGPLFAVGDAPSSLGPQLVWISDSAYLLER
jgi:hypothetical protein